MVKSKYRGRSGILVINEVTKIHQGITITFKCNKTYITWELLISILLRFLL